MRSALALGVALGVAVLYAHGLLGVTMGFDTYLDSLTMLVALLLGGRVLESAGRRRALDAALALASVVPSTARRRDGDTIDVRKAGGRHGGLLNPTTAGLNGGSSHFNMRRSETETQNLQSHGCNGPLGIMLHADKATHWHSEGPRVQVVNTSRSSIG